MLESLTKCFSDESVEGSYSFTFYCDVCGKAYSCAPIKTIDDKPCNDEEVEHDLAFERANIEAMRHFNRCPICKAWVCDDCFKLLPEGECCSDCLKKK